MLENGNATKKSAYDILAEKWKIPEVFGMKRSERPSIIETYNSIKVIELIDEHIKRGDGIAIHCDVDFDGIAAGYIMHREISQRGNNNKYLIINKEKEHGIQCKHVDFLNTRGIAGLLIIVDSENSVDMIKQMNCDVVVIDHHEADRSNASGMCSDMEHRYVIVNSTLDNLEFNSCNYRNLSMKTDTSEIEWLYHGSENMSGAMLVYEVVRLWNYLEGNGDMIDYSYIHQWAAASLFTDQIDLLNRRNQWYVNATVNSSRIDETLSILKEQLNPYEAKITKSFIQYKLAPTINKAIRANAGNDVLDVIINKPDTVLELTKYGVIQKNVLDSISMERATEGEKYITYDVGSIGVGKNYNGIIASKLLGESGKSAAVYIKIGSIYKGSFRGKIKEYDYLNGCFREVGMKADGHTTAFGFETDSLGKLMEAMNRINEKEPVQERVGQLISISNVEKEMRGRYHVESLEELRKSQLLVLIASGNAGVATDNEISLLAPTSDMVMIQSRGNYYKYMFQGDLECISFEALHGRYITLYPEYTNDLKVYARNIR